MKTHRPLAVLVLGSAVLLTTLRAQMPTTPPPPVPAELAAAPVGSTDPSQPLRPTQLVYAPRLPTVQELSAVAKARGYTIERIEQSAVQVVVAYRLPDGRNSVVGYALLANAGAAAEPVVAPAPVVVYEPSPRVVYYSSYYPSYYDPWYYYPPVTLSLGFGIGHGYHGGWHGHGGRWHR
jgi:hypothetical protein